jgi:hypothetical protein
MIEERAQLLPLAERPRLTARSFHSAAAGGDGARDWIFFKIGIGEAAYLTYVHCRHYGE